MSVTPSIVEIDDLFVSMLRHLEGYTQYIKENDLVSLVGHARDRYITQASLSNLNDGTWIRIMQKLQKSEPFNDEDFERLSMLIQDIEHATTIFVTHEEEKGLNVLEFEGRHLFDLFVEKSTQLVKSLSSLSSALFEDLVSLYTPLVEKHLDELVHITISASQEYMSTMFDYTNGELDALLTQGVDDEDAFKVFFVGWNNIFPAYPVSTHGDDDRIIEIFSEYRDTVIQEFKLWFSENSLDYVDGQTLYLVEPFATKHLKGQRVNVEALKSALYPMVSRAVLDTMKI